LVRDQRAVSSASPAEARVRLKQAVFPVPAKGDRQAVARRAVELGGGASGCEAFESRLQAAGIRVSSPGEVRIGDLPPDLGRMVASLPVGQASQPFGNERQISLLMVCGRAGGEGGLPSRDAIANVLGNERLDMLQRRYLIDLRRSAFVEIRDHRV
jgi:peptidyl-prolyl cis-trans isomerase SurA